jgi:hypothetical protein
MLVIPPCFSPFEVEVRGRPIAQPTSVLLWRAVKAPCWKDENYSLIMVNDDQ